MQTNIPQTSAVMTALLRADFTTLWRNRRSLRLVLLVPLVIVISWKGLVKTMGGPYVIAGGITIGLISIGLLGYTNSIARDRDKGVFQRLRVGPVAAWTIMCSRILVQIATIMVMTIAIFAVGSAVDKITLSPMGYLMGFLAAILGGALYLSLGQLIVGLIKNPETVNSTTRLVYFIFIMVGMLGNFGVLGEAVKEAVQWSPYGVVNRVIGTALQPATWNMQATYAMLATIGYTIVFAAAGIRFFKWN
ncbi:ABC transporter permease [Chitinophaga qingshengii]|uniref:ABC transporter permease n=1 Tax=Chitinophaga qingshengii TaxID=1569794 RepID=A0ABR7THP5_9BACT|nr:ABC transporter permease [Chitinophaga qingshengii]MBC9929036.1 ABC transporter permease [Chitinophaga qingshengii]